MEPTAWLMISYHVPTDPSALRVATWRALKQVGAVRLGDGLYLLPNVAACEAALDELQERIMAGGGTAVTLKTSGREAKDAAFLKESFAAAREEEYRQVAKSAHKLVEHIGREEAEADFRFAEVDSLEEELEKVQRQLERAKARDYLSSAGRESAEAAVKEAAGRMKVYLEEAFREEAARDNSEPCGPGKLAGGNGA